MLWSLWGMWHGIQCRSSHLKTGLHQLISQNSVHQIWAKLAKKSQDWSKWIVYLAWEYISFTSLDIGSSSLVYRIVLSFLIAGIICRAWIGISKCFLYLMLNQSPQEQALFIFLQLIYALSEPNSVLSLVMNQIPVLDVLCHSCQGNFRRGKVAFYLHQQSFE